MSTGGRLARLGDSLSPLTRIMLVYSLIRLVLFVAAFAIVWSFPLNDLVRIAIALVASGVLSYPLARRQRAELAERLEERRQAREIPRR
jgi:hypothetical protein